MPDDYINIDNVRVLLCDITHNYCLTSYRLYVSFRITLSMLYGELRHPRFISCHPLIVRRNGIFLSKHVPYLLMRNYTSLKQLILEENPSAALM